MGWIAGQPFVKGQAFSRLVTTHGQGLLDVYLLREVADDLFSEPRDLEYNSSEWQRLSCRMEVRKVKSLYAHGVLGMSVALVREGYCASGEIFNPLQTRT